MQIQEEKLNELLGKVVTEYGAAVMGLHVHIGDKLGLYRALGANGGLTSHQLAETTGTAERYVREWLAAQAATGYVDYSAEEGTFSLSPEQRAVFADESSPALMTGGFYSLGALYESEPRLTEAYRTGDGVAWGDHGSGCFCGAEKFYGPLYKANLVSEWLPALDDVTAKLKAGGRVADIGCGHGVSTIVMAQAFPASQFYGFDFHASSIERARRLAEEAGVNNATFGVATAKEFPGEGYDLVAFFDCLHDLGDPVGAMAHVRTALDSNGSVLIVEPAAGNALEENLHPVGRVYYAFSAALCVPSSLDQEVGLALGAQAGEARIREVVTAGGFSHFRVAVQTPFNMVIEVRE
jgi:SAM-dependent methyltransferase